MIPTIRWCAGLAICAQAALTSIAAGQCPGSTVTANGAGINLAEFTGNAESTVFRDLFRSATKWSPQRTDSSAWDTGQPLQLDENGWVERLWPGQAAGIRLTTSAAGRYHVFYRGVGTLEFGFDATLAHSSPGEYLIDVLPGDRGIYIKLVSTEPTDHLRDIRVIHEDFLQRESPFQPQFLADCRRYGVLRFTDWQKTDNSRIRRWDQRATPHGFSDAGPAGVSLESMLQLANELDADPWFCMPHLADDDFVRRFATMVRERLGPDRKVYVEWSNEVWDPSRSQYEYAAKTGSQLGLATTPRLANLRYYAQRASEVHAIWTQVFGGGERLVRVVSSRNDDPSSAREILGWRDAAATADVLAVAPAFGSRLGRAQTRRRVGTLEPGEVLCLAYRDIDSQIAATKRNAVAASDHGLQLVAYQGGPQPRRRNCDDHGQALTQWFCNSSRQAYMGLLTRHLRDEWKRAGGALFVSYSGSLMPGRKK